jgi:hypothetical protein
MIVPTATRTSNRQELEDFVIPLFYMKQELPQGAAFSHSEEKPQQKVDPRCRNQKDNQAPLSRGSL